MAFQTHLKNVQNVVSPTDISTTEINEYHGEEQYIRSQSLNLLGKSEENVSTKILISSDRNFDENELTLIRTFTGENETRKCSLVHKIQEIIGRKFCLKDVYSTLATTAVVVLLVLFVIKTEARKSSREENGARIFQQTKNLKIPSFEELTEKSELVISSMDWQSIEQISSRENIIHFTTQIDKDQFLSNYFNSSYLKTSVSDGALRVAGKPSFCSQSFRNEPTELSFNAVSHVHLSEMEDCKNYVNLILTKWHFPKVYSIKLHRMIVNKQEFDALTTFISRHNETLHKVEIDESYFCLSPDCDAGMIDFPNHDFKFTITRRREVAKYV
ncbi:hypothetical protein Ocin01_12949 [Orchesella cincta]|uniref:Uncharacterized protein n=1 Tax=Orchesella cincta TaxID=48709 RepID=A0A1D2MLL0_ORCCI|nr:hypothetical protein Ocin01_12949 [Orchesella cincta]